MWIPRNKHIKEYKYNPSKLKPGYFESFDSFIESIREEAQTRKVVSIDGRSVIFGVEGPIIFPNGKFWSVSAEVEDGVWGKHYIMVAPSLKNIIFRKESFLRVDSGCVSGMVMGDITCDCLNQLRNAQKVILEKGGIIIHIPNHDGRGWQEYKMANQRIMEVCDLDTITTAVSFYGNAKSIDCRTYEEAAVILRALGFPKGYKFDLATKNPRKISDLTNAGFIISPKPLEIKSRSKYLSKNLKAKYGYWQPTTT